MADRIAPAREWDLARSPHQGIASGVGHRYRLPLPVILGIRVLRSASRRGRSGRNGHELRLPVMGSRTRWYRGSDLRRLSVLLMAITGLQAVRPTASYRTLELGGTAAAVGLVAASFAALSVMAAVPFGRIIDRLGPKRFLLSGLAVLASGCALSAVAPSVFALAASQALVGLGQTSTVLALQTVTANRSDLDRGFARLTVAAGLGQMLGPLLAGSLLGLSLHSALEGRGTTLVFAVAALLVLLGLAMAARGIGGGPAPPEADRTGSPAVPVSTIVRCSGMPQALITSVAMFTAADLLIAYLPVLGEARGIQPSTIGILLSLRAASGLSSRMTLTAMLLRLGRRRLLLGAMMTSGLAMLGIGLVSPAWLIGALIIVVGFGLGMGAPMTLAWVALVAPQGGRSTALAVRVTGNRIGQVVLPIAAGGLASVLGPGAVFIFAAGTLLGGAAWVRGSPLSEVT